MRKFYVFEVAEGDSKIAGKSVYEYTTETEAIASFHKKLGVAMSSALYSADLVMVIDDNGAVLKVEKFVNENYNAPQPVEE